MLSDNIYDLDCFNEHTSGALSPKLYPSLDIDHAGEDVGDISPELELEHSTMDTLRAPKPQLRSRLPINFYGQSSITGYPSSLMSGSTLRANTSAFPRKTNRIDSSQWFPPELIASLTISDLYHHPHYCDLCERYDYVTGVLASYMDRDLMGTAKSDIPIPDIR